MLKAVIRTAMKTTVIFGKCWDLHVKEVLKTTCDENLRMVKDTIEYLIEHKLRVVFDAEHFFDGFKDDPEYALKVVKTAEAAGANVIVLCDTNGGFLTTDLQKVIQKTKGVLNTTLGIHCHNDSGLATANTLAAVALGIRHVQGTINGLGERCGNADLCQVLPALQLKMNYRTLNSRKSIEEQLKGLLALSEYIYELTNLPPNPYQPYVGKGAFIHKGGIHIDAILKQPKAYEHLDPALVGNHRELSISELAGKASLVNKALELGLKIDKDSEVIDKTLKDIKRLEARGYSIEDAGATVHLMLLKNMGYKSYPFQVKFWRASTTRSKEASTTGEVMVKVNDEIFHEVSVGVGPVHALDQALRKALLKRFPQIKKVTLTNYKVTVVDSVSGTASNVRVFIEFEDDGAQWATTAVSVNILEASSIALINGYTYRLILDEIRKKNS